MNQREKIRNYVVNVKVRERKKENAFMEEVKIFQPQ